MHHEIAMIEDIKVRLSTEQKRNLRAAAMRRGQSLSQYVREVATKAAGRAA